MIIHLKKNPRYCPVTLPCSSLKLALLLCSKTLSCLLNVPRTFCASSHLPLLSADDLASVFVDETEDIWQAHSLLSKSAILSASAPSSSSLCFQQRDGSFTF